MFWFEIDFRGKLMHFAGEKILHLDFLKGYHLKNFKNSS